jgi:diguanylate cyclase (GGDEF)-like protein
MTLSWMGVHHDASILFTAWGVGLYAYYLLCLFVRRALAHDRAMAFGWMLGGALCAGTGMWAQTLLGLVAWQAPIPVGYATPVVLAAWLPAVVVVVAVQWQYSVQDLDWRLRIIGGLFIALGLSMLGLVVQSAVVTSPAWVWAPSWAAAGTGMFLVACALASVLTRRWLYKPGHQLKLLGLSAVVSIMFVLGNITQLHAVVIPAGATSHSVSGLTPNAVHTLATTIVSLLLVVAHLATLYDVRAQRKEDALRDSLAEAQSALKNAGQYDPVTHLYNRLGFEHSLQEALRKDVEQTPLQLAVVRLNLDGFKTIVESYGQHIGDHIARLLALRLQAQLRQGDVIARSDSDEFMVFGAGLTDDHQVTLWARRLGQAVAEPCLIAEHDLCLNASIGIARYPDSASAEQLMAHTLDAMLMARKAGGGVHCIYQRGMERDAQAQVDMQRDLRHAIERGELTLHFQPKLHAADGRLAGVEALLRWHHPERGHVSPVDFIPVAERFGLIGELGLWVLDAACRHVRQWTDAGLNIPVAVNLSAHQLRQPDLELRVRDVLQRHGVPANMLIMEITESTAMDDIEASLKVFDMLDTIGVRLSIDDFGTGYSSLSYLRRLPARQLKIDRSFVRDLGSSLDAQAIVEAVVRLAHALGLTVVAEGVETQEQADILRKLQCDEFQGFLFARPMPEQALLAWLVQHEVGVMAAGDAPQIVVPGTPPEAALTGVPAPMAPLAPVPAISSPEVSPGATVSSEAPSGAWAHLGVQRS